MLVTSNFSFSHSVFKKACFPEASRGVIMWEWVNKIDWLIVVWCLTPFLTLFQLYRGGHCTYSCFPRVHFTSTCTIFFPSEWLLSPHNHRRKMDSAEREMNPVSKTIIKWWSEKYITKEILQKYIDTRPLSKYDGENHISVYFALQC